MSETTKTVLVAAALIAAIVLMMWALAPRKRLLDPPRHPQSSICAATATALLAGPLAGCFRLWPPPRAPLRRCYRATLPPSPKDPLP